MQFAPTDNQFTLIEFKSPSQTIGSIIRGYKIATIKRIKDSMKDSGELNNSTGELQFAPIDKQFAPTESQFAPTTDIKLWQRNYYDIIRDERAYENISNYIINNPTKWTEDKFHLKQNKK